MIDDAFCYTPPAHTGLDIVYQDDALVIVNKPAGLLSVPGRGEDKQDCLISRVQADLGAVLLVHRLDMDTSGLVVFARHNRAQRSMAHRFQNREVHKRYQALVSGLIAVNSGEIELPLLVDWPNRPRHAVNFKDGKPSHTLFEVLAQDDTQQTSRVLLTPVTGRTHQLRIHMQAIGHPIVGDRLYNAQNMNDPRLCLHACQLEFRHPFRNQHLKFDSAAPF